MILSKTVSVKWNNATKSYYLSKGCEYTKSDESFEVKISDLKKNSKERLLVKCDMCGKEYDLAYSTIQKGLNKGELCKKCVLRKRISDYNAERRTKQESFLSYCLREQGSNFLKEYWSNVTHSPT